MRRNVKIGWFAVGIIVLLLIIRYDFIEDNSWNSWNLPLTGEIILLDPGHGGPDGGAGDKGALEKDIALNVSLKDLMKDPEYRGMMIEVMKDPELQKGVTDILKSNEYRQHIQTIMTETFESPLFKAKIQDLIIKAAGEVQTEKKDDQGGGESGGEGQDQGSQ